MITDIATGSVIFGGLHEARPFRDRMVAASPVDVSVESKLLGENPNRFIESAILSSRFLLFKSLMVAGKML